MDTFLAPDTVNGTEAVAVFEKRKPETSPVSRIGGIRPSGHGTGTKEQKPCGADTAAIHPLDNAIESAWEASNWPRIMLAGGENPAAAIRPLPFLLYTHTVE